MGATESVPAPPPALRDASHQVRAMCEAYEAAFNDMNDWTDKKLRVVVSLNHDLTAAENVACFAYPFSNLHAACGNKEVRKLAVAAKANAERVTAAGR